MKKSSPSKYKDIELCPAFEADQNRPEHPITAEGTLIHNALETGDDRGLNEDQLRLAEMCRDFIAAVIPKNAVIKNELVLPSVLGDRGRCDMAAFLGNVAWLIDYKMGYNAQPPVVDNPAAQAYALGLFEIFPYLTTIHAHYLYPRRDEVSSHTFHRSDCPKIIARLVLIKERNAVATPETCNYIPEVCVYCLHLGKCPTAARELLPLARKYNETHDGLTLPEVPDFSVVNDPHTWQRLLNAVPVLEAMADSIKHHANEWRLTTAQEIPGYSWRTRKGKATILNPLTAWAISKQHGVTEPEFLAACNVSAKQLLDAVREKAGKGKKEKAATALKNELCDAGTYEEGAESGYLARDKA